MESVAWDLPTVVAFPERVDVSNAAQIGEQVLAAFDRGAVVVIADMSGTASCDDAGVDALARAYQQAAIRHVELRLVAGGPTVRRQLAAQGLDRLVPVYSSVEAAVAAGEPNGQDHPGHPAPPTSAPRWPARPRTGSGRASVNEAVLRRLIDALADGIVLADEDGRIVLANRRGRRCSATPMANWPASWWSP